MHTANKATFAFLF